LAVTETTVCVYIHDGYNYIALLIAAKHFHQWKTALNACHIPKILIALLCDNRSAIDLAETHQMSKLSEYINFHHHHVGELFYNETFPLMYIQTMDSCMDMSNKGLPEV
jgi:hypothetical protein